MSLRSIPYSGRAWCESELPIGGQAWSNSRPMRPATNSILRRARFAIFLLLPLVSLACACDRTKVRDQSTQAVVVVDPDASGAPATLNERFESEDLDVAEFVKRFEGESREIYAQREHIVSALGLQPGDRVADIGAGTGLFSILFGHEVGREGRVYAVDISQKFLEHLKERAFTLNLPQIKTVLCTDKSTALEPESVDAVFICDTYHHFEYPEDTLASIHSALRPGGRMMIVDFHRIPGVTKPWLMKHVRCGKDQVLREVEAAGFRRLEDPAVPGLDENYVILFARDRPQGIHSSSKPRETELMQ